MMIEHECGGKRDGQRKPRDAAPDVRLGSLADKLT